MIPCHIAEVFLIAPANTGTGIVEDNQPHRVGVAGYRYLGHDPSMETIGMFFIRFANPIRRREEIAGQLPSRTGHQSYPVWNPP